MNLIRYILAGETDVLDAGCNRRRPHHFIALITTGFLALIAIPALATNRTVTNLSDSGTGSLRDVIAASVAADTIDFSVTGTITLTTGELPVAHDISINGPGANMLTVARSSVSATPNFRVFNVTATGSVTFSGLTISNGNAIAGGGIANVSGTVNIINCTLTGNSATGNSAGSGGGGIFNDSGLVNFTNGSRLVGNFAANTGGGIYNLGRVSIDNSTVSGNSAGQGGGGIFNVGSGQVIINNSTISGNFANSSGSAGGGIYNNGTIIRVFNSTVSGNSASGDGGGIFSNGSAQVNNSTISSNSAVQGGGILITGTNTSAPVKSSIIALNTATSSAPDVSGTFTSNGFNLVGKNDGAAASFPAGNPNANNDIVGTSASPVDPLLGPLQNNGGPTFTHALLSGSPAIDKGVSNGWTVDQRGVGYLRTIDNTAIPPAAGGDNTDVGAFEFGAHLDAVSSKTHGPDPDPLKTFGIDLPLGGTLLGIECRRNTGADSSGPNAGRDHEIILTFPIAVTVAGASVTSNDMTDTPTVTFSVSSNVVTVDLHNIANAPRRLTINLTHVSDGARANDVSIPMGVLLGDVNGDTFVLSGDYTTVRKNSGNDVGPSTFKYDVNADGFILSGDYTTVRKLSGTQLPSTP